MSTKNFTDQELSCRCGCGAIHAQAFQNRLQVLRDAFGVPMHINSAARCMRHNQDVNGAPNSSHLVFPDEPERGAVDVEVLYSEAYHLTRLAFEHGWRGIGVSQKLGSDLKTRFIHLDTRPDYPRIWSY